jgi:hypothetical protein
MGWVVAITAVTAFVMLRLILSLPEAGKDWRDQAEGLRQRASVPRASYADDREADHAYNRLNL